MAFTHKLEKKDGTPADPPTLHTAVPNWRPGRHDPARPGQDGRSFWIGLLSPLALGLLVVAVSATLGTD